MSRYESAERVAKLPKWAQAHIAHLKRDALYADDTIAELRDLAEGAAETNVLIDRYDRAPTLLPPDSRVSFFFEGNARLDVSHTSDGDGLEIYCYGLGMASSLEVRPSSSNVIKVYPTEYR